MSNRTFQHIASQIKETSNRAIGVVNRAGLIVASNDAALIGSKIEGFSCDVISNAEVCRIDGRTLKCLSSDIAESYCLFTEGEDELAAAVCAIAAIAISEAGSGHFEENYEQKTFLKNIVLENVLPGDVFVRSKELMLDENAIRGVIILRSAQPFTARTIEILQHTLPDQYRDFVLPINNNEIIIIKEITQPEDGSYLKKLAQTIEYKLRNESSEKCLIGIATPALSIRELPGKYKEAAMSIEIGSVFNEMNSIMCYEELGLSRLIYQIPTTLAEIFLSEVFKKDPIDALDKETLTTINSFFDNSLNVSETARKLFVHRNTLVYRLEKIKRITGLDIRDFEHAIIFKVALMVKKYLFSQETKY